MQGNQKHNMGFTLIELMMAVAIVAVLCAVSIPNYGRLVTRAKVAEGLALVGPVKAAVVEYYAVNGELPQASNWLSLLKELGLPVSTDSGAAAGSYVQRLWWNKAEKEIRIRYGVPPVDGGVLALQASLEAGRTSWRCYSPQQSIPAKYLPKLCHG